MIFEKQDYQQECIANIIEILREFDFKRHDAANLRECLVKFGGKKVANLFDESAGQGVNIAVKNLSNALNIDILMETGTGKTFTYLNLIYEINRVYRQNKFIIFLPRKAILESVRQNIELTKDYFANEYAGKRLKSYFYSDAKSLSNIITHYIKNTDELSVLVLTSGAMNKGNNEQKPKTTLSQQESKKINILHRSNEFLPKSVFESIAELKPISIIDEPHLLKGEAFAKNFAKLNSLYFRFGATFPTEKGFELSNVAFVLDSISAFRQYLVKQVAVQTLFENDYKPRVKSIESKAKRAKFAYFLDNIEYEKSVKFDEDLGVALNYSALNGVQIHNASADELYLSNGEKIQKAKENYSLNESQISHLLQKAINLHFEKEQNLFKDGIKALSLFFIPSIKDFRGENPFIKKEFERLYKLKRDEILKQDLDKKYRAFLQKDFDESGNLCVLEGYFSGDKSGKKDNAENAEAEAVKLILSEKEKLLSLNTPLRFIFSVWALQEGWDNPNIFTLTKLASSASETSKRQQIGRGLRLCVNQHGKRMTQKFCEGDEDKFYELNRLDVLVHSSEMNFIEGLQSEINKASFVASGEFIEDTLLENLGLNKEQISLFCLELKKLNLVEFDKVNNKYKIKAPIYEGIKDEPKMREILEDNFHQVLKAFAVSANKQDFIKKPSNKIEIRHILANKFKNLWQSLNLKAKIKYENIDENLLLSKIKAEFKAQDIVQERIKFEEKIYNAKDDKIEIKEVEMLENKHFWRGNIILNLKEFAHKEDLPLKFVLDIYNACKDKFKNNPNVAFAKLKELIKEQIHQNAISCVSYEFSQTRISNDPLFDEKGQPRKWIERHKLGQIADESIPNEPYLYEQAVYDSKIERAVMINDEKELSFDGQKAVVKVFAKLPKLQIPTPYKNYEPDFAYLIEQNERQIFFICETKGYDDMREISTQERRKIDYAKRFFEALQGHLGDKVQIHFKTRLNKEGLTEILQGILRGE